MSKYKRFLTSDDDPLVPRTVRKKNRKATTIAIIALIFWLGFGLGYGLWIGLGPHKTANNNAQQIINNKEMVDMQIFELSMIMSNSPNVTIVTEGTFTWRFTNGFVAWQSPPTPSAFKVKNVRIGPLDFTVLELTSPAPGVVFDFRNNWQWEAIDFTPPALPSLGVVNYNSISDEYMLPLTQGNINRMQILPSDCTKTGGCYETARIPTDDFLVLKNHIILRTTDTADSSAFFLSGYFAETLTNPTDLDGQSFSLSEPWELIFPSA